MPTSSLWAEVTISGFMLLGAIFFLALKFLGIHDLAFFSGLKDYLTFLSIGVVILSYIFGILTHRLIIIVGTPMLRFVRRLLKRPPDPSDREGGITTRADMILVWQYGSERLQKELDYQINFLVLYTSMTVVMPFLGISACVWLVDTAASQLAGPICILGIALGVGFLVAYFSQLRRYRQLQSQATLEMEEVKKSKKS